MNFSFLHKCLVLVCFAGVVGFALKFLTYIDKPFNWYLPVFPNVFDSVFLVIAGTAVINASDTAALTTAGVPSSTIAIYALVALMGIVAIVMLFLRIGLGGK